MPPDFTDVVSGHIERATGRPTRAARNGEEIHPGQIYFAPGHCHMKVAKLGTNPILLHCQSPAENFCRPAVNVLFRSAAQVYGRNALAIVLTGMGSDGLDGARALVQAGATVIAQDQATSVVWGMPGAVAQEGLASAILPLDKMASRLPPGCADAARELRRDRRVRLSARLPAPALRSVARVRQTLHGREPAAPDRARGRPTRSRRAWCSVCRPVIGRSRRPSSTR